MVEVRGELSILSEAKDLWLDMPRLWLCALPVEPKILRFAQD